MSATSDKQRAVIKGLAEYPYPPRSGCEADLVMKGGITSGVVYPLAVCELAKKYTFRNVGGSSAGGIAAALAAAAEHARDRNGFQRLAVLPERLGDDLPRLFQPSRGTRPLFEVFRAAQESGSFRWPRLLWRVLSCKVRASVVGAAVVVLLGVWATMLAGGAPHDSGDWLRIVAWLVPLLPVVLGGALVGAAVGSVRAAFVELPRNGHGLCIGSDGPGPSKGPVKPFTDWMHDALQEVAGFCDGVLTFGDLWGKKAAQAYCDLAPSNPQDRDRAMREVVPDVRLEMMTTNVTQRRPMRLPFVEDRFHFCPEELTRWFPPEVLTHLMTHGAAAVHSDGRARFCPEHPCVQLHKLPEPPDFPVVLAVRMTLSFPGLISAVPLWAVDYGRSSKPMARCWFSDGGISSNFPLHFFDQLLPCRPTFAISLGPYPEEYPDEDVYYPNPTRAPQPKFRASDTLGAFLRGILDTMQNWSDNGQGMISGYRDRIVEVRQRRHEGGMNLSMNAETILGLAVRGRDAAAALTASGTGFDFDRHRRVRAATALSKLQQAVEQVGKHYDVPLPGGAVSYRDFIGNGRPTAVGRIDLLLQFVGRTAPGIPYERQTPDFPSEAPRPEPDLRIVARF